MKRGIQLEIPNEYGSWLGTILQPFDIAAYHWYIGGEEAYFLENGSLGNPLFPREVYGMDGMHLKGMLEDHVYYVIFANLKAYPKEKDVIDVRTYEEFLHSDCQLALLVVDCVYVAIYCRDMEILDSLYHNAAKRFDDVRFITDANDTRVRLSVW